MRIKMNILYGVENIIFNSTVEKKINLSHVSTHKQFNSIINFQKQNIQNLL